MSGRVIPTALLDRQRLASDPMASAWVSANAGAGKTHVLSQRVIRLLLHGTPPAKILCLTFTKAAAANMANRVFDTLRRWTAFDDDALDREIAATGSRPTPALRERARRLFAEALETPGGLKVQTIHAFCTRVLQQFPFEANVAARFRVLEEVEQQHLLGGIRLAVLLEATAKPDSDMGRALAVAVAAASDQAFETALDEAIGKREAVAALCARGLDRVAAELSARLGVAADDTDERLVRDLFEASHFPMADWPELIAVLNAGSKTDRDHAERLADARAASGEARIRRYLAVFCTAKLTPRDAVITRKLADNNPDLANRLAAEQARVCRWLDRRRAVAIRDRTLALLAIAGETIRRYQAEKERRGLLDYDDLIAKARALLDSVEAAWVHYKLDLGIDHVLIDEAQDTSPEQWDIVERLVREFAAGAGARSDVRRTVFAVGDDKQSIFSFQGAAPAQFNEMKRKFGGAFAKAELAWRDVRLEYSFRSGANVLGAVQDVFGAPDVYQGVTFDRAGIPPHMPLEDAAPGFVELWPIIAPEQRPERDPWDAPFDVTSETSPRVKLARRIAAAVARWRGRHLIGNEGERRAVAAGDILVLVRQRGPLFEAIIRALKDAGVPVAGADRLVLTEHVAVMDLLALADALLLPEDDLALAIVLKSPLFGLTDDDLFKLAWRRGGPLRAALRRQRPDVAAQLDALAMEARRQTPFSFYAALLGAGGGRKAFLGRLGPETNDALDEFLNLALDYESRETPTLQGFAAWMRSASAQIKRDLEIARDEVRVMTVHGAKGLEAPIVILADTTTPPAGPSQYQPRLLPLPAADAPPGTPDALAWMPTKEDDVGPVTAARNAAIREAENEYRRLLYVAMTRAAERLIVCGAVGKTAMPGGCWYQLVEQALAATGALIDVPADDGDGTVRRYQKVPAAVAFADEAPARAAADAARPEWLTRDAPAPPRIVAVTPSDATPARTFAPAEARDREAALQRGRLMHRLLQSLPDVARERRREAALAYLARAAADWSAAEHETLLAQALAVLNDTRVAPLFAAGSRAEVPIAGRVEAGGRVLLVNGQIDRLAVTPDAVMIADFKTNRPAPRRLADVPEGYVRQLALYRALLRRLYPGRALAAALIWTEVPDVMEISDAALEAALARLTAA